MIEQCTNELVWIAYERNIAKLRLSKLLKGDKITLAFLMFY